MSTSANHPKAMNGHVEVTKELLRRGVFKDPVNTKDVSPLHMAAENHKTEVVRALISDGANVKLKMKGGFTALHLASDSIRSAKLLIEAGADINAVDDRNVTILMTACTDGKDILAKYLLETGADAGIPNKDGDYPLQQAAKMGHHKVVLALWDSGVSAFPEIDTKVQPIVMCCGNPYLTSLFIGNAVVTKNPRAALPLAFVSLTDPLRGLVRDGVDINVLDGKKRSPLFYAAMAGPRSVETVRFLLEQGMDRFQQDIDGRTTMDVALAKEVRAVLMEGLTEWRDEERLSEYESAFCGMNAFRKLVCRECKADIKDAFFWREYLPDW